MSETPGSHGEPQTGPGQPVSPRDRTIALLISAGVDPHRADISDDGSAAIPLGTDDAVIFRPSWPGSRVWNWELHPAYDVPLAPLLAPLDAGGAVPDSAMRDILASAMTQSEMLNAVAAAGASGAWLPAGGGRDLVAGILPDGRRFTVTAGEGETMPAGDGMPLPARLNLTIRPAAPGRPVTVTEDLAACEILTHIRALAAGITPAPPNPGRVIFPRGVPDAWNSGRYLIAEYTPAGTMPVRAAGPVSAARAADRVAPAAGAVYVVAGPGSGRYLVDLRDPATSDDTAASDPSNWTVTKARRRPAEMTGVLTVDPALHHPDEAAEHIVLTRQARNPGQTEDTVLYIVHDNGTGHRAAFWQQPGMPLTRARDMARENTAALTPAVHAALAGWEPSAAVTLHPPAPGRPAAAALEIQPAWLATYPERGHVGRSRRLLLREGGLEHSRPMPGWLADARVVELGKLTEHLRGKGFNATADFAADTVIVSGGCPPRITKDEVRDMLARKTRSPAEPAPAAILTTWASYPAEAAGHPAGSQPPGNVVPRQGMLASPRSVARRPPRRQSPGTGPVL